VLGQKPLIETTFSRPFFFSTYAMGKKSKTTSDEVED
jgi:hypothetical protein